MALHESVLEEFGLAPMWVRRGIATREEAQVVAPDASVNQARGAVAGQVAQEAMSAQAGDALQSRQEHYDGERRGASAPPVARETQRAAGAEMQPPAAVGQSQRAARAEPQSSAASRESQRTAEAESQAPVAPRASMQREQEPASHRAASPTQAPSSEPPNFDIPPDDDFAWFDDPGAPAPASAEMRGDAPALPAVHTLDWDALAARVSGCEACRLCEKRTNTVFGVGDREADWMLVGEAPGENEDRQGEPFVGQAGKLLDNMLRSLTLARGTNVYIANVIKCRPPGNRNPQPDEVARCEPYLQRQVALVKPKLIVALGRFAAQSLLKTDASISSLRGRVHAYEGVPVIITYHPAYLLRSLPDKAKAWADLCLARDTWLANGGTPSTEAK
ncbi:uracil-DNA glycosylase [Burkholderia sp. SRS-W-2-2016]|uniref:uracil-DNA glycosylase family protein n=1 Tax=Burkholderia sp. SRS-W-2-2016 TaxID=1926878 RepID=UPI00094B182F|nr:uracil-DNA glycosylase family protein [Burkholderia sp. SRS-W-2-2016]OLL30688.1 uracil-DNA glycosylase [Burkholderia sp. SRS-W-2-2016]